MVKFGKESRDLIFKITEDLYKSVSHTLGPNGSNSLIVKDGKSIVTNDGVSIINSIKFDKNEENMIFELLKESISNTENQVGDGTTSTMILLYNIIKQCLSESEIENNQIAIRSALLKELEIVLNEIEKYSKPIKQDKEIYNIALISSGGYSFIADLLLKCFKQTNSILLEIDENSNTLSFEKMEGFTVNSKSLKNISQLEIEAKILIISDNSVSPEDLKMLMELKRTKDFPLILLIGKVNEEINVLLNIYSKVDNLYIYSLPEFGEARKKALTAITFLTNCSQINKKNMICNLPLNQRFGLLGDFEGILENNSLRITKIKEEDKKVLIDKLPEKKEELTKGIIKIKVGGPTEAQAKELYYRIEDSMNSVKKSLEKGYLTGAGSILYRISNNDNLNLKILRKPLKSIALKLVENNGLCIETFRKKMDQIEEQDFGFNAKTNEVENLEKAGIIDPTSTIIATITNAVNIASSIITVNNINLNNK